MIDKLIEVVTKISSPWSLTAFAILILGLLILKNQRRRLPYVVWAVVAAVVILVMAAIFAPLYSNSYGLYRVRVSVLDEHKMPTDDAQVTCSIGGEPKKVRGGWEIDIPAKTKPADGKVQIYASVPNDFLTGSYDLDLLDDYNPVVKIFLKKDTSAYVMGIVVDENNNPVEGAHIAIVGYDSETAVTKAGGNFSLAAHKADGQQVQLFAFKSGYYAGSPEWHQAGDHPIMIVLRRQR